MVIVQSYGRSESYLNISSKMINSKPMLVAFRKSTCLPSK
jgi:hypothetical protein